jgi:hypothetical protein
MKTRFVLSIKFPFIKSVPIGGDIPLPPWEQIKDGKQVELPSFPDNIVFRTGVRSVIVAVLLAAGAALFAVPAAHAGTITIMLSTATGPCAVANACQKVFTDTDANLGRINTAYAPACQQNNLVGTPPIPTACTAGQTLVFWFNDLITNYLRSTVTNFLTQQAQAAVVPVTPINPQ